MRDINVSLFFFSFNVSVSKGRAGRKILERQIKYMYL